MTTSKRQKNPNREGLFWEYIRWLLDRDPEYAAKLIARREGKS